MCITQGCVIRSPSNRRLQELRVQHVDEEAVVLHNNFENGTIPFPSLGNLEQESEHRAAVCGLYSQD